MKSEADLKKTFQKLGEVAPGFCLAKWKNSTIHLHNGHTQSCHHVRSQKIVESDELSYLHNSPDKLEARRKMLAGKKPSPCHYCWKVEELGHFSDRVHKSTEAVYMDYYPEVVESGIGKNINPSFLELSFDSTCQFRCMYCNPAYSTAWQKEDEKFGPYPTIGNKINKSYNRSRLPLPEEKKKGLVESFWRWWPSLRQDLRYLRLTGGEPFLSEESFRLIEEIVEKPLPNLHFAINTNLGFNEALLTRFLNKIAPLTQATKELLIFTSIDSVGEQAEYIRHGLNTHQFWINVKKVLDQNQRPLTLCFMVTVNILSLPGLNRLIEKIANVREQYPHHNIQVDLPHLFQPEHLSVELLPTSFNTFLDENQLTQSALDLLGHDQLLKYKRIKSLISKNEMNPAKKFLLRNDFQKFIREYDRRKSLNFESTFPEYKTFIQSCASPKSNFQQTFLKREI